MLSAIFTAHAAPPAIASLHSLMLVMYRPTWPITSSRRTSSKASAVSIRHNSYGCGFVANAAAVSLSVLCLVILLMSYFSVRAEGRVGDPHGRRRLVERSRVKGRAVV